MSHAPDPVGDGLAAGLGPGCTPSLPTLALTSHTPHCLAPSIFPGWSPALISRHPVPATTGSLLFPKWPMYFTLRPLMLLCCFLYPQCQGRPSLPCPWFCTPNLESELSFGRIPMPAFPRLLPHLSIGINQALSCFLPSTAVSYLTQALTGV